MGLDAPLCRRQICPSGKPLGVGSFTHGYFRIDLDMVWDITQRNLGELKRKILKIKKDLEGSEKSEEDAKRGKKE